MKTEKAIEKAGSPKALAELCGVTPSAISQWGENLPRAREWQLRLIRPEWFQTMAEAKAKKRAAAA